MRAIVAGGSGILGRQLVASLVADGYETIVLSRRPQRVRGLPPGARAELWDGQTAAGWGLLADGADAIINLAGVSLSSGLWTAARKRAIMHSRSDPGRAIVEAVQAARTRPGVVIQQSGIGHYGFHAGEIITEPSAPGSDFLSAITLDWEAATAPVEAMGVRRVVTRTAFVLSMKNTGFVLMSLPFRFYVGGPLGSGRQWFPWIHIADYVGAVRFLMAHADASGAFNVASPNPVTNAEFARLIGKVMRRPAWFRVPAFAMRLVLGELSTSLLEGQRAVPARLQQMGYSFRFPDAELVLQDLLR